MKKCSKCGIEKELSEFSSKKNICKNCQKEYYEQNKKEILKQQKEYLKKNKEVIKKRRKKYYNKIKKSVIFQDRKKKYEQEHKEDFRRWKKEYYIRNKDRSIQRSKEYYQENLESIKIKQKLWREKNREERLKKKREYYEKTKEKFKQKRKDYYNKTKKRRLERFKKWHYHKLKTDTLYKVKCYLRKRTYSIFKVKKWKKTNSLIKYIGCDKDTLIKHLESQFTDGMTWKNQGKWHIDHIIPLSSAKTEEELYKLCHYTNLQPLWAEDNLKKGNKIIQ